MNSRYICPGCSTVLLRHINMGGLYWRCSCCCQEMPIFWRRIQNQDTYGLAITVLSVRDTLQKVSDRLSTDCSCLLRHLLKTSKFSGFVGVLNPVIYSPVVQNYSTLQVNKVHPSIGKGLRWITPLNPLDILGRNSKSSSLTPHASVGRCLPNAVAPLYKGRVRVGYFCISQLPICCNSDSWILFYKPIRLG